MQIDQFPHLYEAQRKAQAQQAVQAEEQRSGTRKNSIRADVGKPVKVGDWVSNGFMLGLCVGFFCCCGMCKSNSIGSGLATWVVLSIVGAIAGAALSFFINREQSSSERNAKLELAQEGSRLRQAIEDISAHADQDSAAYRAEFEAEAQRCSVKFVESALAKEVINWMTDGFARTIEAADRRSHIEKLVIPFNFNVYAYQITCNLGAYDFELHRCARLSSPLEQTALARAIASAIQLNITMKYPQDMSGTAFKIDIGYTYAGSAPADLHASVTITYTAPNGNYRPVSGW